MKNTWNYKIIALIFLGLATIFINSCSTIGGAIHQKIKKPEVEFLDARLDSLSFNSIGLMFDLKVKNPNSVGIKLAGFNYDFLINGNTFVKGQQDKNLEIGARGESPVQFPVSFGFVELYNVFQSLKNQDISSYQINLGFAFNVPVLGVINIPVSKSGDFPLLKIPKISLESLKLRNLSLTGADLRLGVKLNNPNAFSMLLDKMKYNLEVNGLQWISGESMETAQIAEKGEGLIEIPIRLNLVEMGRSVYQLLNSNNDLNFAFGGDIDLNTSLPLLGKVNLPFNHSGKIKVTK